MGASNNAPGNGLVAYFPFNGNANDESGNMNNGTVYGNAALTVDRFNRRNNAYYFDGIDDYIITEENDAFDNLDSGAVSFWMKIESAPTEIQSVLLSYSTDYSVNSIYSFVIRNNLKLEVIYKYKGAITPEIISVAALELRKWYHVVFVADGKNRIKFYLNNQEIPTTFISHGTSANGSEWFADLNGVKYYPHFITIGAQKRNKQTPNTFFHGVLDDIRVYDHPLSEAEIDSLYHENGWK